MEVLTEAPKTSSFVSLAEHQSVTPASFYQGPPVLHYHSDRCKLIVLERELGGASALANLVSKAGGGTTATTSTSTSTSTSTHGGGDAGINGDDVTTDGEGRRVVEDVDVWVASDKLFIFSHGLATGLAIPYPSIALHAIQSQPEPSTTDASSQGLYMQLISNNENTSGNTTQTDDDGDFSDSISITIIPTRSPPPSTSKIGAADASVDTQMDSVTSDTPTEQQTPVSAMFTALSNCSNLHPDPVEDGDDDYDNNILTGGMAESRLYQSGLVLPGGSDGGLPPPMPGSGGWITAENMHEFFDEQGNWLGGPDGDVDVDFDGQEDGHGNENGNGNGDGNTAMTNEPLGPGAGTTRPRADDAGESLEDGGEAQQNNGEDAKWRRID